MLFLPFCSSLSKSNCIVIFSPWRNSELTYRSVIKCNCPMICSLVLGVLSLLCLFSYSKVLKSHISKSHCQRLGFFPGKVYLTWCSYCSSLPMDPFQVLFRWRVAGIQKTLCSIFSWLLSWWASVSDSSSPPVWFKWIPWVLHLQGWEKLRWHLQNMLNYFHTWVPFFNS